MDAPQTANSGHPGTPWRSRRWPTCSVHPGHELRRRRPRAGPTATASCCRPVTRRCCSTRCCYLTGYGLTLDDLRQFRQWGSATPGHPEYRHTAGVEVTTGPLGQGVANGVGIAHRRGQPPGPLRRRALFDHHMFVHLLRRRPLGGRQPRGRVARRPPRPRSAGLRLRRQPHLDRRPDRAVATPTTPPERFGPTAGTSSRLGEVANDCDALEAGLRRAMAEEDRARPGRAPQPHRLIRRPTYTDTADAHGNPLGAEEIAEHQGHPRAAAGRDLLRARRRPRRLPRGRRRGRAARDAWEKRLRSASTSEPQRPRSTPASPATACPAGPTPCPSWEAGEKVATRRPAARRS